MQADEEWLCELHWEFKRQQGYSELEIARKRDAIEKVLVPEMLESSWRALAGGRLLASDPGLAVFELCQLGGAEVSS